MSQVFFDELKLDSPDIYLDAKGATQMEMMADIMVKFEKELQHYQPDLILVPRCQFVYCLCTSSI